MSFSRAKLTSRIAAPHPSATINTAPPPPSPKAPSSPVPTKDPIQTLYNNFHQVLIRQNVRWLHISYTFYSLIILENSKKNLSLESIGQFIEVINWRAQGKITEEEFSILYSEWMNLPFGGLGSPRKKPAAHINSMNLSNSPPPPSIPTLDEFRLLLLEKNINESNLDLFIGIIVHEVNSKILNTTINYKMNNTSVNSMSNSSHDHTKMKSLNNSLMQNNNDIYNNKLEIVTKKWLLLSEELFFLLDISGYGYWKYEECFFFCVNICLNLELFKTMGELENDLSLISLNVLTFQLMKDIGVQLNYNTKKKNYNLNNISNCSNITITMLKRFLIKKNLNENDLILLIQLLKNNIENLIKLIKINRIFNFYNACQPLEFKENLLSTPKLFQESVLIASGYYNNLTPLNSPSNISPNINSLTSNNNNNSSTIFMENIIKNYNDTNINFTDNYNKTLNNFFIKQNFNFPSIINYLLCDGEKELSIFFHSIEFDIENFQFISDNYHVNNNTHKKNHPLFSTQAANIELNEIALKLYINYNKWINNNSNEYINLIDFSIKKIIKNNEKFVRIQQDPIYKLILSCLLTYKKLQKIYIAAVQDIAIEKLLKKNSNFLYFNENLNKNNILLLCVNLLPKDDELLYEMDLFKDDEINEKNNENRNRLDSHDSSFENQGNPNLYNSIQSNFSSNYLSFDQLVQDDDDDEDETVSNLVDGRLNLNDHEDINRLSESESKYYNNTYTPTYYTDEDKFEDDNVNNEENKNISNKKKSKSSKNNSNNVLHVDISNKKFSQTIPQTNPNKISSHIQSERRKNADNSIKETPTSPTSSVSLSSNISTNKEKKTPNYFKPTENFLRNSYNNIEKVKINEEEIISNIKNYNEKEIIAEEDKIIKELLNINDIKQQKILLNRLKEVKFIREVITKYKKENEEFVPEKKVKKNSVKPKSTSKISSTPIASTSVLNSDLSSTTHANSISANINSNTVIMPPYPLPTSPTNSQSSLSKNNKRILEKYYTNDTFNSDSETVDDSNEQNLPPPPPTSPPQVTDEHDYASDISSSVGPNSVSIILNKYIFYFYSYFYLFLLN